MPHIQMKSEAIKLKTIHYEPMSIGNKRFSIMPQLSVQIYLPQVEPPISVMQQVFPIYTKMELSDFPSLILTD